MIFASSTLLVVAIAVLSVVGFSAVSSASSTKRSAAVDLANARIEEARNIPYDNVGTIDKATGRYGDPAGPIPTSETTAGFVIVTRVTWARAATAPYRALYKNISVVVSWTAPSPGRVTMSSAVYGRGDQQSVGDVQVTVVGYDAPSAPIPGAMVVLTPSTGLARTLYTGTDGVAAFGNVPRGSVPFQVPFRVTVDGLIIDPSEPTTATVPDGLATYVVRVQHPSTAQVTVADAAGNPVPGVTVLLSGGPTASVIATSDGTGIARFSSLLIGNYTASVTGPTTSGNVAVTVDAPTGRDHSALLRLHLIASVVIKAQDSHGQPVSGATVTMTGSGSPVSTVTGADGQASFANLDAGTYAIAVAGPELVGWTASKTLVGGANGTTTANIKRYGRLTISYQDQYGKSAAGTVTVYQSDDVTKIADVLVAKDSTALIALPPDASYYVRRSDNQSSTFAQANPIAVTDGGAYTATVKAK